MAICSVEECECPNLARGLCRKHYQQDWFERKGRDRKHGLVEGQYAEMLAAQGGRCAICDTSNPGGHGTWHVDHDHSCCPQQQGCGGCVRGLLCFSCNILLGVARDDPERLSAAIRYLGRF